MAKITVNEIPAQPIPPRYTLELSHDEATVLLKLCANVGGIGQFRDIVTSIYKILAADNTLYKRSTSFRIPTTYVGDFKF
jgi:hypothetical protein